MRRVVIVAMVLALAGCQSIRSGLGQYKRAADKGVELRVGGAAPDDVTPGEPVKHSKDRGATQGLPGGLGGDPTHAPYIDPTPR